MIPAERDGISAEREQQLLRLWTAEQENAWWQRRPGAWRLRLTRRERELVESWDSETPQVVIDERCGVCE